MKKFKLFTTIASLCLAVALMAFGVYAATTVSATVSGSIKFDATDVDLTLMNVSWYATNVKTITNTTEETAATLNNTGTDAEWSCSIGDLEVANLDTVVEIHILCKVKNVSNTVGAKVSYVITADDAQYSTTTKTGETALPANSADGVTCEAVVKFKVADKAQSETEGKGFSVIFTAAKVNA